MEKQEKYKSFLLKFGYWAAILIIVFLFIKYLLKPLAPFLIALAIVMIVRPLVRMLTKKLKINQKAVSIILVILCYLLVAGLLALIIAGIVSVVVDWAEMFPDYFTNSIQPGITEGIDNLLNKLNRIDPEFGLAAQETMPEVMSTLSGSIMDFSMKILSWASDIGTKLPGFFLATVICIISSIFLAVDYDQAASTVMNILPPKVRQIIRVAKHALGTIVGKYLKSYMLILLMTFAEISIGLLIIGVDSPLRIAALIAVFDILPIVGSGLVLAPWAIINLVQGRIGLGIGLAVLWAIVIVVREYAVGKQVGLHPLVTLVCLWVGLKLGGALGMFALPIGLLVILDLKAEGIISFEKDEAPKTD